MCPKWGPWLTSACHDPTWMGALQCQASSEPLPSPASKILLRLITAWASHHHDVAQAGVPCSPLIVAAPCNGMHVAAVMAMGALAPGGHLYTVPLSWAIHYHLAGPYSSTRYHLARPYMASVSSSASSRVPLMAPDHVIVAPCDMPSLCKSGIIPFKITHPQAILPT